jgi:4-hydroxy-4-methyl-2-oxoglutarate aldolase
MNDYPAEFGSLSTATISDALDRIGVTTSLLGLRPLTRGRRLAGRAFTVRYVAAGSPPGTVGDYIDDVPAGHVVVLDNGGRVDCTVWGDILTAVAAARHLGGTVIDGVCRDVARAVSVGYPIYSRGYFMRTGKDRVEVSDVGTPVTVAATMVRPGDLLVGDDDGVVVVPAEHEARVLEIAREISDREDAILRDALGGTPLRDARARHGYHRLQRPEHD